MYFYETGKQMKGSVDFKNINVNANVITPSTVSFSNDTIAIKVRFVFHSEKKTQNIQNISNSDQSK